MTKSNTSLIPIVPMNNIKEQLQYCIVMANFLKEYCNDVLEDHYDDTVETAQKKNVKMIYFKMVQIEEEFTNEYLD